ncbi:ABC transporter [Heyndrickxia sporothermodurans]|uniref:ABC transporter permease n=1 Tax=Heyndrickxia sporothermodurans TaxID=46224 RepID=A0AB37HGA2_9BACI|nr:ABC transporter permease [Heyndrickxia sporothermodurans]MBL5768335.1 ABC transporter permease [Heyndrickxia sporothermodurans]MBL5771990.1 ABC transporter permease [Heyndrickxia sporothermodurans]MBL5775598.1 ABC transporter permease [Heyndrickxia sporothermodurans]MBL5779125.1 ABC transporter permease [Heyndrickxia sporothermodurans]MBL5786223.1 ABC transporter permease [Heyndrickxia sporothermodurans]
MTFSFKRVNAIFIKDWKDLQRNSYIIFTLAIPLVFAAWLSRMGEGDGIFSTYPINLALVIAGAFIQAAMVAEEKEKNTLRGLLLSPASTVEIFVGKSALSAVMTIVVIIGSIFLSDFKVPSPLLFAVSVLLGLVFYIAIGTILGLISRTVMETSIIGMPVLVVFGMSSMFKSMVENKTILKIIDYLPNEQLNTIWVGLSNGESFSGIIGNILILLVWAAISIVTTVVIFRKRRID